ncbi:MAG TPA: DUF2066 domain-containing protein [Alphaproteobacteria bacterium]|nr:DUF2066 domain-containing protein [Alphaproteobacteria bacterium]
MFQRSRNLAKPWAARNPFPLAIPVIPIVLSIWGLVLLAPVSPASAQSADVFTVRDVHVDETAGTAAQAREHALAVGQRLAIQQLFARLTLKEDEARLPRLSDAELADVVGSYEVQTEKNSPVRYIGTLTYHFNQRGIEQILRDRGIPFAATMSKPIVVLPVLQSGNGQSLWDEPNPWRRAWTSLPPAGGLVPFVVPGGDRQDSDTLNADDAVRGNADKLTALARRYATNSTLVAIASPRGDANSTIARIDVSYSRQGGGGATPATVISVSGQPAESSDALFARAARQVEDDVSERWKQENLIHFGQAQEAIVTVPLASLEDWVRIRRALEQIPFVSRVDLVYFARDEARVDLHYLGDPGQLKLALAQRDLLLTDDAGGMMLRPASGAAAKESATE